MSSTLSNPLGLHPHLVVPKQRSEADIQASVRAAMEQHADPQPTTAINNEPGQQVVTFRDRARLLIERGIPVIRLRPRTKIAMDDGWQHLATCDPEVIDKWNAETPDANVGAVAKAIEGTVFFFEVDSPAVVQQIESETGHKIPTTFKVRSRKGRGHIYLKHSAASIQLGNVPQKYGDFSVRANNEYVVGANSLHPETGEPYEIISSADIVDAPDWLVDWIRDQKNKKVEPENTTDSPAVKELIPHGKIHSWLVARGGKLRADGLEVEDIESILLREVYQECESPIDEEKVRQVARSMENYKPGTNGMLMLVNGELPFTNPATATAAVIEEESEIEEIEDKLPEFPRFSGLLAELCEVVCPDVPYEFKVMAAVTHWGLMRSGLDSLEGEPNLQPRFYTCLIALPGTGKTAAINEIRTILTCLNPNYISVSSVDSGPALVDEFVDQTKKMMFHPSDDPKDTAKGVKSRVMLDPDEMTDLFEKSKQTAQGRNSLFGDILRLFETNRTGNRSRKAGKSHAENAHLAILAGATPEGYEKMWTATAGGASGLQSRFVPISTAAGMMPIDRRPTNPDALDFYVKELIQIANQPGRVISIDQEAKKMLRDWWGEDRSNPNNKRIDDMVKRLVIVLAVTSEAIVVGPDLMRQAIQFGDYVLAAREKYNPSDSHSWTQAFEQAIIKVGQKHKVAMTMRDYRRFVQPNRRPGGFSAFQQAWKTLIQVGVLKSDGETRIGSVKYRVTGV